jgi:hypothetical protein
MYQEGRRIISHHKRHVILIWFVVILLLLAGAGVYAAKNLLKADTTIGKPPKAVVSTVTAQDSKTKKINKPTFTFELPKDWKFKGYSQNIYHAYIWENTGSSPGVRELDIYEDNIPTTLGVNRLLPVEAEGSKLAVGNLSDNCASFTGDKVPGNPSTPAKWSGVNFLCDLGNYERNVVGTSTTGSINKVILKGPTTGAHGLFFTYTDNSAEPDYNIFFSALQSFRLK